MPSVIFINRVYPPAEGATGHLLAELAAMLVKMGWEVTVVTSRHRLESKRSEIRAGVKIEYVGGLPFTRTSLWKRGLSYLSLYPSMLYRTLMLPRADVVVTMTDPPLHLTLGPFIKLVKRSRLVHWAQDIYPDLAEQLSVLKKGGVLAGLLRYSAKRSLALYDKVVTVGDCMREILKLKGVAETRLEVIPNWCSPRIAIDKLCDGLAFRSHHGLSGQFIVMYSGNFGLAHTFDAIVEAARKMQDLHQRVQFVFIGQGPRLGGLRKATAGFKNVRFLSFQPPEMVADCLRAADVHLVSIRDEVCGLCVPSKVYGVLAAGRTCIFLGPKQSEAARILEENDCGIVISASATEALVDCLLRFLNEPDRLAGFGFRAGALASNLSIEQATQAFLDVLMPLVQRSPAFEKGVQPTVHVEGERLAGMPSSETAPSKVSK